MQRNSSAKLATHLGAWICFGLLAGMLAQAAPSTTLPKKVKNAHPKVIETPPERQERYNAQEDDGSGLPPLAPPNFAPTSTSVTQFDAVPSEHRESIAERLRITAELVRLGRAYDYRDKTTAELREILAALQSVPASATVGLPKKQNAEEQIPAPPAPPSFEEIEVQVE